MKSPVVFYLPKKYLPSGDGLLAQWRDGRIRELHQSGKIAAAQCWIYQTHLELQRGGVDVPLVHEMPTEGIVIGLSGFFPEPYTPPDNVYFVAVAADYHPHAGAHMHLLQNGHQVRLIPRSRYVPLWTHPNLVVRDPARGGSFGRAAFFGDPGNLADALQDGAFARQLEHKLGVHFEIRRAERWHDYSDADCAVGIRSFDRRRHLHKPPTKLFNAWLAGVPFIGGADSAYRAERHSALDYLEARSLKDLYLAIETLQSRPALREAMVKNGTARSQEVNREAMQKRWAFLVENDLPSACAEWFATPQTVRRRRMLLQKLRLGTMRRLGRFLE